MILPLRLAIVWAAAASIWLIGAYLNSAVFETTATPAIRLLNACYTAALGVGLVVAARHLLDRRDLAGLGLPRHDIGRPMLAGLLAFVVPSIAGLVVATSVGWLRLAPAGPVSELIAGIALLVVTVFFYEALPEELIFRGYLYRNLAATMAPWLAAVAQAVLFALFGTALWVITSGWGVFIERATLFVCMGFVLGLIRLVSGSVWACIGFHLGFQIVAQTLHGPGVVVVGPVDAFAALPSFVLGALIVMVALGRAVNWTQPEPERS